MYIIYYIQITFKHIFDFFQRLYINELLTACLLHSRFGCSKVGQVVVNVFMLFAFFLNFILIFEVTRFFYKHRWILTSLSRLRLLPVKSILTNISAYDIHSYIDLLVMCFCVSHQTVIYTNFNFTSMLGYGKIIV